MAEKYFDLFLWIWIASAVIIFPFLFRVTAPFGRHTHSGFGPLIPNRWGWIIMESPALWWFGWWFLSGENLKSVPMWIAFGLWMLHYVHRTLIFPFRIRTRGKKMPLVVAASAFFFQLVNGFFNGNMMGSRPISMTADNWLSDPRFAAGVLVFILGMYINLRADRKLIALRGAGESGYKIPQGGWFRYISCPNFFGEILEWTGFAILCWNLAALSFALWTFANLIPRAVSHHRWYLRTFADYPPERKAVIPFLL